MLDKRSSKDRLAIHHCSNAGRYRLKRCVWQDSGIAEALTGAAHFKLTASHKEDLSNRFSLNIVPIPDVT